jgi:MoaA/NifB/PqqE/SkfB family radical SAM enzyme
MHLQNFPNRIAIELSPECNLSCRVCPRNFIEQKKGHLAKSLWVKLIKEIAQSSPESVVIPFWRGEALLHPDFYDLIKIALGYALRIHMSTNGVLLEDKIFSLLAECEFVTFSIHNSAGYNNAKKFLNYRRTKHPVTQVSFVEGESSMKDIYSTLVNSPDLEGFDSVRVYARHSQDGVFGSSQKKSNAQRVFCPKLEGTLVIAYDGTISRCNHIWETEKEVNLENMSILEAWNSGCLKKIRQDYPDAKCEPCGQWNGHTCGELWQNENGKIRHKYYDLEK